MQAVIEHLCANPAHQPAVDVSAPVIPYSGRWAYCPAGESEGHDWRATGGKTLATVREWLGRGGPTDGAQRDLIPAAANTPK